MSTKKKIKKVSSAFEKEKTKMRERKRRAITTNILAGLRKYGGYNLGPRADINEVLRCLAAEAGWVVHPDGTTYRPSMIIVPQHQHTDNEEEVDKNRGVNWTKKWRTKTILSMEDSMSEWLLAACAAKSAEDDVRAHEMLFEEHNLHRADIDAAEYHRNNSDEPQDEVLQTKAGQNMQMQQLLNMPSSSSAADSIGDEFMELLYQSSSSQNTINPSKQLQHQHITEGYSSSELIRRQLHYIDTLHPSATINKLDSHSHSNSIDSHSYLEHIYRAHTILILIITMYIISIDIILIVLLES